MADLNERVTLVRRAPAAFAASRGVSPPLTFEFKLRSLGDDGRHYPATLRFLPFVEGATLINVVTLGGIGTSTGLAYQGSATDQGIENVQGELPSGTRIRFGSGQSAFVVTLESGWAPNESDADFLQYNEPMEIFPAPGRISVATNVTVSTGVDWNLAAPMQVATSSRWCATSEFNVSQDIDDRGNEVSRYLMTVTLRYDRVVATDRNIVLAQVTDALGWDWNVIGVEWDPQERTRYMRLRCSR